ncbi:oxygen-independent coproporphyrinogen III oxidase [Pseudobacter ginsenosidimutans]|uniref:Coproporphyrinogen-III oxidase n=1 Tax=Pseudobacter ginsenosidimutans TaxID=661488 RepID=A0A4Q7MLD9_9BACT|nr:oxygen-independent coproporphyrinogen III oxidase [Pseudobacter ginsenosidimutans]RZS69251.1 oxygen-independent coproporphyrinogen-3 oxidase [Pseudobacter ginsenosidimutans]
MISPDFPSLLQKYDVPAPRYTSYPTVPYWDHSTLHGSSWTKQVAETFRKEQSEISLYMHLPFCESLCTFCACNKRITKNHGVEEPYIQTLLKEWELYIKMFPDKPVIREIHLGGGTPTFFSPSNLWQLIHQVTSSAIIATDHAFSFEAHPGNTTEQHLQALSGAGFNRISVGVQDFDPVVQQAINRIQSFERTKEVIDKARKLGYSSVNVDLVYGLPHQTTQSVANTMGKILQLMPDRIAYYSYAHVPWKSKVQRRYTDADLPAAAEKLAMYQLGKEMLVAAGYIAIGMDHFALPGDPLLVAAEQKTLNRNFMGYTTTNSKLIIGLGASAISDGWGAFAQNEKTIEAYEAMVQEGKLPIVNGHLLTDDDLVIRRYILDLMCRHEVLLNHPCSDPTWLPNVKERLQPLVEDGLVVLDQEKITVTDAGKSFVRNICAALDARLHASQSGSNVFSKAI